MIDEAALEQSRQWARDRVPAPEYPLVLPAGYDAAQGEAELGHVLRRLGGEGADYMPVLRAWAYMRKQRMDDEARDREGAAILDALEARACPGCATDALDARHGPDWHEISDDMGVCPVCERDHPGVCPPDPDSVARGWQAAFDPDSMPGGVDAPQEPYYGEGTA